MKVLGIAASNSSTSINKKLVTYAASLIDGAEVEILDLNDYEMPLYSADREKKLGKLQLINDFLNKIKACDALIISFAEHNGSYTVAYKNILDWTSRFEKNIFQDKPMVMLSTSPGARGGASVLTAAVNSAPFFAGDLKGHLSIPKFHDNFDSDRNKLIDEKLDSELMQVINQLITK
jgi:NAD(P)H-dependent FMN reductase